MRERGELRSHHLCLLLLASLQVAFASPDNSSAFSTYTSLGLSVYGNELQRAQGLWSLTNKTKFNEDSYFVEWRNCYNVSPHKHVPYHCWGEINHKYGNLAALWTHSTNASTGETNLDCSYSVEPVRFTQVESRRVLEYRFVITQSRCSAATLPFRGGTTFEVFGSTRHFLASCSVRDTKDDLYHVLCRFSYALSHVHDLLDKRNADDLRCLSLTVVVVYEHLDVYSEAIDAHVILDSQPSKTTYPSPRYVLADGKSSPFCFPSMQVEPAPSSSPLHSLPPGLVIYSAVWQAASLFAHGLGASNSSYFGRGVFHTQSEYWQWRTRQNATGGEDWHALIVRAEGNASRAISAHTLAAARPEDSNSSINIIGASHARYLYDALDEYERGPAAQDGANRKHASSSSQQLNYLYRELADDVADAVSEVCVKAANAKGIAKTKIVIHTGSWDLSVAGPRMFVRDANALPKLMKVIEGIVEGSACPSVTDIVWLTNAPYPLHDNEECLARKATRDVRGYRHSPSIAAANQRILEFAFALMSRPSPSLPSTPHNVRPTLTIVDFFSIVKPRLGLNLDAELACCDHLFCRVEWDKAGATVFTPGGKATFDAALHALY